jgi:hypothetical protein
MLKTEKKKKVSRSSLIKKLDTEFSLFIRKRYAKNEIATCYTCGKQDNYKNLQCGHFQSRKHYSTRWDEVNCQVQCYSCNVMRYGEQYKFGLFLNAQFGEDTASGLMMKAKTTLKIKDFELIYMIENYKKINSELI